MERNIAVLRFQARCHLFWIMNVHGIGEAIVGFSHFFAIVPSIGFILGLPTTTRGHPSALPRLVVGAKVMIGQTRMFARLLTLTLWALLHHLMKP